MARTCSAKRLAGTRAAASRRAGRVALLCAIVVALGGPLAAAASGAVPAPTNLRIIPATESLRVRWGVTSSEGITGFRVRWRPAAGSLPWSAPVERSAASRGYTITGLAVEPYEVRVRAILAEGAFGGAATGFGTPLAPALEEGEEEPPGEEPGEPKVLPRAPAGVPAPAGGWNVVLADAFAAPIGTAGGDDRLWQLPQEFQRAFNGNELEVWSPQQVSTISTGLDLACTHQPNAGGTGKNYLCGFVNTKGHFAMRSYAGSTFALECVCKWPKNTGEADPGWWQDGSELGIEQELDDFEGYGWHADGSWEYGAGIPVAVGLGDFTVFHTEGVDQAFGFDPTVGFHRYTTLIRPATLGRTEFAEYIDGAFKWRFFALTPPVSVWQHLILSYALREYPQNFTTGTRHFDVRSVEVYQDAAHAGRDVTGGGIAPGTSLAP